MRPRGYNGAGKPTKRKLIFTLCQLEDMLKQIRELDKENPNKVTTLSQYCIGITKKFGRFYNLDDLRTPDNKKLVMYVE